MANETMTAEAMADRAKKMANNVQAEMKDSATSMTTLARKVLLASVGAVALTKDEIEQFVSRLVERGEIAEQDGRKMVKDVLARRRAQTEQAEEEVEKQMEKAENVLDERIEAMLTRLNVPTKNDIDTLSQKITALSAKVDALKDAE